MNRGTNRCSRWAFASLFLATACAAGAQAVRSERTISWALDRAGPHTIDSSRRKANTSASLRVNTTALLELSQKNPAAANLGQIDGFMLVGGGLPIRAGSEVIGGIGVGGAPGGHLDDQCSQAGIDKIKDRLN